MQNYTIETIVDREFPNDPDRRISLYRGKGMVISPDFRYPIIEIGLCRADQNNPTEDRTIEWYDENVLKPLIESGEISDGSKGGFDDRKMRYDSGWGFIGNSIDSQDRIIIKLGHSHFLEYREKRNRTKEEAERLTQLGLKHFNDPYAFFGRNPGVTGIILTSDKKLIVGQRKVEIDEYEDLLQGVAGHLDYKRNPSDIKLEEEMSREAKEEAGVTRTDVRDLEFLGLFSDPRVAGDDLDFCYLIKTDVHSDYFTKGFWKEKVKKPEHNEFYAINNFDELEKLVNDGNFQDKNFDIVFSTRGALSAIKEKDFL